MAGRKTRRSCAICGVREAHLNKSHLFANFPLEETRCREWVRVTGNEELVHVPIEKLHVNRHICENHFKRTQFNKKHTRLKRHAVPCLNLKSTPLSDDQMTEFPLHVWKKQVSQSGEAASTSYATQRPTNESATGSHVLSQQQVISTPPSTSKEGQEPANQDRGSTHVLPQQPARGVKRKSEGDGSKEGQQPANQDGTSTPVLPQQPARGDKRKSEDEEFTPRKKKLVERLRRTQCNLKSLKKSATLIEKIESPVLKELVVNSCKNEKRKPKGRRWTIKHKISCLAILKRSPKTYRYLSAAVTLPSEKTLHNILQKLPMTPGLNSSVLNHLKMIADSKDPKDRICNLAFDEMALKSRVILNDSNDVVEGYEDLGELGRSGELADHALVFLLQGLRRKYKQPIAFYLTKGTISSANLAQIIKMIISQVKECGFTIMNTVCDQGPINVGAMRLLREASGPFKDGSNHYFRVDGETVYIVYDIPHLFKSIRNNFLNAGCVNLNGVKGKWEHLLEVETLNRQFLYFSKITQAHVKPKYKGKMKVKLAAQALSNTVAAVLKLLARAEKGDKAKQLQDTAHVVEKLDQLLDISNGPSSPMDTKKGQRQNVSTKTKHMEKWAEFIKILEKTKFTTKEGIPAKNVKCVEGFIISLKSLRDIWSNVQKLGFKYLNLRNLNQDALENLFGIIRQHSPTNRNPSATHFMAALKTSVVTGLTAPHSRGSNCENDKKTLLTNFHDLIFGVEATMADEEVVQSDTSTNKENEAPEDNTCEDEVFGIPEEELPNNDFSLLSEQPTVYVAGYLAKTLLKKNNCQECQQYLTVKNPGDNPMYSYIFLREWWQNKFSLTYPSTSFCDIIKSIICITEKEMLPQMHTPNICLLGSKLYNTIIPPSCFPCQIHGKDLKSACFALTCKLLLRRQCQIINNRLASKEEHLACQNKRAEQSGRAK